MGQKISTPSRKQPPGAVMSGVPLTRSTGGSAPPIQQELSDNEEDFIDVNLINVNQTILKQAEIGTPVQVQGFRVFTGRGPVGEIPHALRSKIKDDNFRAGVVLSIDRPVVRLFNR